VPRREPAPPPNWPPHEWAALPEAFNRIVPSGGPLTPALHALRQDLLSGRLESALRQISRDGQETWRSLEPSDWRQWRLQLLRTFQSKPPEIKVIPIDKDEALDEHEHRFFVRRADLDKRYPVTPLAPAPGAAPAADAPATAAAPEKKASDLRTDDRRRKPGPKIKHDWRLEVAAEVHRRKKKGGRTPTAGELAQFCLNKFDYQPDESDINRLVRILLDD
jgi:hypothetical protein